MIVIATIAATFTGGCATSTPYPVTPHTHAVQNVATVQQQQVGQGVVVQQVMPRAAMWRGLGPAKASDDRLAFLYGVAVVAEKFNRAFNPRDYYGYGGYGGFGGYGGGYGYRYSALTPAIIVNAQRCAVAYSQGHVTTPNC